MPKQVLKLCHFLLIAISAAGIGVSSLRAAEACSRVWTIPELLRNGSRLDGQVICVRSVLRPLPLRDRTSPSVYVYEAVARAGKSVQPRAGLITWDEELGIDESLYRPESESLLTKAAARCAGAMTAEPSFTAEFRAVVAYKKNLTEQAFSVLPPQFTEKPHRIHYDLELVLLEVLKATAICN